jgi:hypothetical protein
MDFRRHQAEPGRIEVEAGHGDEPQRQQRPRRGRADRQRVAGARKRGRFPRFPFLSRAASPRDS